MSANRCTEKSCVNYDKPYCRLHGVGISTAKKPAPVKPRSEKLDKKMKKQYVPKVKEMVAANTKCAVKSPDCIKIAQGFHHLQGRDGEQLTGKAKIPCCNPCNVYIEKNDSWARSKGLKKSKFSVPAKNQKISKPKTIS